MIPKKKTLQIKSKKTNLYAQSTPRNFEYYWLVVVFLKPLVDEMIIILLNVSDWHNTERREHCDIHKMFRV